MKLYYSRGSCSLAPHITLLEVGQTFEAIPVTLSNHQLPDGSDYHRINPQGYVPLLELDDGTRLTEGPAIMQYIADNHPDKNLAPANGSVARAQMQGWLNYISCELHKNFAPAFDKAIPAEQRAITVKKLMKAFTWVDKHLAGKTYLLGEQFSVADAYLFTVSNWAALVKLDISGFAHIAALRSVVQARPAVRAAMKAEGLVN